MSIGQQTITCGICGKEGLQAMLLGPGSKMCSDCYRLFSAALRPKVETSGWPANQTNYYSENHEAVKVWEDHMKKCGFTKTKSGKWRNKKELNKNK